MLFCVHLYNNVLLYWTASVDFKNSYDEWCVVIQKAQDKARCLLKEYDQKFVSHKVQSGIPQ